MKQYYDTRAPEYDEWYRGLGKFAARERPGWSDDLEGLTEAIGYLPPARTLDVACGTGYLTRHLRGEITALDQSEQMLAITRERVPDVTVLCSDALNDGSRFQVYKRFFDADELVSELGGGTALYRGRWFVMVSSRA